MIKLIKSVSAKFAYTNPPQNYYSNKHRGGKQDDI